MTVSTTRKPLHQNLGDQVYEQVRDDIIALEIPPGAHLREAELAERFAVSKTPVRDALARLASDGLVDLIAYRGALVTSYTNDDLMDIYDLRGLVQGSCAREAALSISADDLAMLGLVIRESRRAQEEGHEEQLPVLFNAFDEIVYRQTSNNRIRQLILNLDAHLRRIGNLTVRIPGRLEKSVEQHEGIYEAIVDRDPNEAESLMRKHAASVLADQLADHAVDPSGQTAHTATEDE
jgi:DNA-binding GntR family transcriptional regulator